MAKTTPLRASLQMIESSLTKIDKLASTRLAEMSLVYLCARVVKPERVEAFCVALRGLAGIKE